MAAGGVEGVVGGDGFGCGDGAASRAAAEGGGRGDGGWVDAQAVADKEGEFGVGEEGTRGDGMGGEEGGGASEGAGAEAGGGKRVGACGEAGGEELAGEGVGENHFHVSYFGLTC